MKKSLIALAVMAAAGAASAQSSVTLFGIVDAAISHGSGSLGDRTRLVNSGYNSSRLGFRGTEDLGGGMSASFWLEAGVNNDDGSGQAAGTTANNQTPNAGTGLAFNRRSTVSLAGGWGELRLGRDYTPAFWNLTVFDPFGTNGVGTTATLNTGFTGITTVRASNSIGYFLPPNLGGFYGQLQYYLGENLDTAVNEDDGRGYGLRVGFASGPFNVALGYGKTEYLTGDIKMVNLGGSFKFGMGTVMAQIVRDENGGADGKGWLIGGLVPVGAGEVRLSFSRYETDLLGSPEYKKLALGYVHNLSKRTAVYATYARVRNNGASAVALGGAATGLGSNSNGFDLGVRHSF
jgi:predicted porin